jgi:hypothetical protein
MHETLATLSAVLALSLPVVGFFTLAGRAVLRFAAVEDAGLTLWLLAPTVGALCWSALSFFVLSVVGFHAPVVWIGAAAVVAASLWALRGTAWSGAAAGPAASLLLVLAAVAVVAVAPLLPATVDGGLYYGTPIFDHVKAAVVDSIYRAGLPPISPFIAPDGKPAGLFYYYGWFVLAAQLRALTGCSGYLADVALSHATALSSLALVCALAYRIRGSALAIAGTVLVALAASPLWLVAKISSWSGLEWLRGHEWGMDPWLEQNSWVPQHVFAAGGVVVVLLGLCWLRAPLAQRWRLAAIIGMAAAAAVTASIYAGALVLAVVALPAALLMLWDGASPARLAPPLVVAVALAAVLAAPMILNLVALGGGPDKIVAFWIYPSVGFLSQDGIAGKVVHLIGFWLVLLPVQLGLAYGVGLWQLRRLPAPRGTEQFLFWTLSLAVVATTLLVAQFAKSALHRNDLGWRIIVPAVVLLTGAAGAQVGCWLDGLAVAARRKAPIMATARAAAALVVVIGLAIPLVLISLQRASQQFFAGSDLPYVAPLQVHRLMAAQPAAWRDVQARTRPADLVISNPKAFDDEPAWGANLPWALFADRSAVLSSANWAELLSSQLQASGIIDDYAQLLDRVFAGQAAPQDVDRLAGSLQVRMIVVTPLDGLWADDSTLAGRFERVAQGDGYRLYAPRTAR